MQWVSQTSEMVKKCDIKNLSISLQDDELFIKDQSGLYFLYVPGFGLRHMEFNGTNDRLQLEFILENLKEKYCFFDVGASYGYYGLNVGNAQPLSEVYCFEAVPTTFRYLLRNIEYNNIKNVRAIPEAVDEKNGMVHVTNNNFGSDYVAIGKNENTEECASVSLDYYVTKNNINKVDYIKIDVEGAELLVLNGAQELIKKFKPIIQVETTDGFAVRFGYKSSDIFSLMSSLNYTYFFLDKHAEAFGVGKLKSGSGNILADMAEATEFFFYSKEKGPPTINYQSKYFLPLHHPYV
jgi:FkbM family methyltransferase